LSVISIAQAQLHANWQNCAKEYLLVERDLHLLCNCLAGAWL